MRIELVTFLGMFLVFHAVGSAQELPHIGNDGIVKYRLVIREGPPEATAFSYNLANKKCVLGVGTIFQAEEAIRIINGEIWYRVSIRKDQLVQSNCSGGDISGWIAGKLKAYWTVSFDSTEIKNKEQIVRTGSGKSAIGEEREVPVWLNYSLLLVGSLLAVCFLAIERTQKLKPREWFSKMLVIEFLVLGAANFVFVALLMDTFIKDSSTAARMVSVVAGRTIGFLLIGFILSIVLHKFIVSSKS